MKYAFASVIALSYLLVLVWIGVYLIDGEWLSPIFFIALMLLIPPMHLTWSRRFKNRP